MKDAEVKQLIKDGHMTSYEITNLLNIKKLLVMKIYFDNHEPVLIRKGKWEEYWEILDKAEREMS